MFHPRRILNEIVQGYSKTLWRNNLIYFKHFTNQDLAQLDFEEDFFSNQASEHGLKTEDQKIKELINDGLWDISKFSEIKMLEDFVRQLESNKKNLLLDSQIKDANTQIKESKEKLNKLLIDKTEIIGFTVENYVQKKINEFYIFYSLFMNSECDEQFFDKESFDALEDQDLNELISIYNNLIREISGNNLKKLAVNSIFQNNFHLAQNNIFNFYGKPIVNLTVYQTELFVYGQYYKPMLESSQLTDDLLNDPDKLVEWFNKSKNIQDQIKESNDIGAVSIVGATKEELVRSGANESQFINLRKIAQQKGENLNTTDLMRAFNR